MQAAGQGQGRVNVLNTSGEEMQDHMHHKRRLLIALGVTGVLTVGFGSSVFEASAQPRTFVVTFLGGITRTVTVDVGIDTPVDSIRLPGLKLPILSIREVTTPQQPSAPITITPGAPAQKPPAAAAPSAPTADAPSGGEQVGRQRTTGKKLRLPRKGERARDETGAPITATSPPKQQRDRPIRTKLRTSNGVPTLSNPSMSLALPGPAPVGVPNFFINKFKIPPFLLPIYQAAGIQYGIRWEVLAAINEIETDYGRNLNVSSAGAMGWMQFIPSSWKRYGVDGNQDKKRDPYNPVDAIFAAARYLKAAGGDKDLRKAVFAYNHADWYVDSVLMRARLIGGLPADLVGSLSGLTQGHFPVHAAARYADDLSERATTRRVARGQNAAMPIVGNNSRRGINIFAKPGSPVIAVQDGKITKVGRSARLGRYVMLRDVYGNTYTFGHLKKVALRVPVPKEKVQSNASVAQELALPKHDPKPTAPASAGRSVKRGAGSRHGKAAKAKVKVPAAVTAPETVKQVKERLFANPDRPGALRHGGREQILDSGIAIPGYQSFKSYFTELYGLKRDDVVLKRLVPGRRVIAGTILGRIGKTQPRVAPHVLFEVRPAGRGAPRIDPKPILDGWKLLESTAIYRAQGKNPFFGPDADSASIGQILLLSKEALQHHVLSNPRIELYSCGARDIRGGVIDRRVLASLEFLAASGLKPTVTSLRCGHGFFTKGGNVSEHSSGNAVDIAKINGIPILGHQGEGSITDITIRRLLTLQGTLKPHQIISLMTFAGTDNTMSLPDHADHIHVGFRPQFNPNSKAGRQLQAVLKPNQWIKLIERLGEIANPTVRTTPSKYAIKVPAPERSSSAHQSE
ncbi:MAG: lytic murein transglycosylase [Actinomycetota bacterium]|nr:lytic murein transglycosylase [Actinomycetota bacterium]